MNKMEFLLKFLFPFYFCVCSLMLSCVLGKRYVDLFFRSFAFVCRRRKYLRDIWDIRVIAETQHNRAKENKIYWKSWINWTREKYVRLTVYGIKQCCNHRHTCHTKYFLFFCYCQWNYFRFFFSLSVHPLVLYLNERRK